MRDPRFRIYEEVKDRLSPSVIPVYSFIPDNTDAPFIYMGDIALQESPNKEQFLYTGYINIEVFSGTHEWVGSIAPLLTRIDEVKSLLKTTKRDTLDLSPNFHMITWTLDSDTGLQQYSVTDKLFVATMQFGFAIDDLHEPGPPETEIVVHFGVDVEHDGEQVIHTN